MKSRAWTLLHQPLFHSYAHHDAAGFGTWTQVLSGHKFWVAVRTKGYGQCKTREEIDDHGEFYPFQKITDKQWGFKYPENSDRCVIFAERGDLM